MKYTDIVQLPIVVIALNEFVIFSIISVLTIPAYERHCNQEFRCSMMVNELW
jgi:hypothetical protein